MKRRKYVLDSHALVAYLQNETIADQVEPLLDQADRNNASIHMSHINLGEIVYIVERRHGVPRCQEVLNVLAEFPIQFEEVTLDRVLAAAHLKAHHAISHADAFALGLAQELGATIVTGDPEFRQVESLVQICWLQSPLVRNTDDKPPGG